jgi:hypothetical protein
MYKVRSVRRRSERGTNRQIGWKANLGLEGSSDEV